MQKPEQNYAFVDGQNVHLAIKDQGWRLDWKRFRVHLRERYGIGKAFIFLGYIEGNNHLYSALQDAGFICIFKPTLRYRDGTVKGNVDAELVLRAMIELPNYERAVVVSGDGDFYCLIEYLRSIGKLLAVLVPNRLKYSALLKRFAGKSIEFMNDLRRKVGYPK